ncbi:MAG TPA: hypothetical protein VGU27_04525, partial [Candidatus Eisenbacteria bacterium]|nr:hypothetical protein [Candidatus Eisenbacteria bacterium]
AAGLPAASRPAAAEPPAPAAAPRVFPALGALRDPREPYLVPLLALLASRALFWRLLPHAAEDAYITFRCARNLVAGFGAVYNPGARVLTFTSPLWMLWSALGQALGRDPVVWARATSLAADAVTLLVLGALLRRRVSRAAAWCFTAFFASWTYFAAVAMSGMEASALLAVAAVAAALVETANPAAGVALAALGFVRPEGFAIAAALAWVARGRDRALFGAFTALGLAGLWLGFGTIVPQGVVAKAMVYGTPGLAEGRQWWEWFLPFQLGRWPVTTEGIVLVPLAAILCPAAVVGAAALLRQGRGALAALAAGMLAVWVAYGVLGVAYFYWYLATPLAAAALLGAVGLPRIVRGGAVYAGIAAFVLGTWTFVPSLDLGREHAEAESFGAVADALARLAAPGQRALLEPIGLIGWRCPQLRITDEVGLASPDVARRRAQGDGWLADVVAAMQPDWIVIRRSELEGGPAFAGRGAPFTSKLERDRALGPYGVVRIVNEAAGDQALVLLGRRPGR